MPKRLSFTTTRPNMMSLVHLSPRARDSFHDSHSLRLALQLLHSSHSYGERGWAELRPAPGRATRPTQCPTHRLAKRRCGIYATSLLAVHPSTTRSSHSQATATATGHTPATAPELRPVLAEDRYYCPAPNLRFASSYTIQLTPTAGPTFNILGSKPLYSPRQPSLARVCERTSRKPVYFCGWPEEPEAWRRVRRRLIAITFSSGSSSGSSSGADVRLPQLRRCGARRWSRIISGWLLACTSWPGRSVALPLWLLTWQVQIRRKEERTYGRHWPHLYSPTKRQSQG